MNPRVIVSTDVTIVSDNGLFYSTNGSLNNEYLEKFRVAGAQLVVAGPVVDDTPPSGSEPLQAQVIPLHPGNGPFPMRIAQRLRDLSRITLHRDDIVVPRIPEITAVALWLRSAAARTPRFPFFVADPVGMAETMGLRSPAPQIMLLAAKAMRRASHGAIWVTQTSLQAVVGEHHHTNVVSPNAAVHPSLHLLIPRLLPVGRPFVFCAVGQQESPLKGHQFAIRSLYRLREAGIDARLEFVGGGSYQSELRHICESLGLSEHVTFHGQLKDRTQVFCVLRHSDALIHPSLSEGLPRAIVEAMTQGLPIAASTAGGSPELVLPELLSAPGDVDGLHRTMLKIATDSALYAEASQHSLTVSDEYLSPAGGEALRTVLASRLAGSS